MRVVSSVFSRPINFLINRSMLENIKHSFLEIGLLPVIAGIVWQVIFFKVENEILMQKDKLLNFHKSLLTDSFYLRFCCILLCLDVQHICCCD